MKKLIILILLLFAANARATIIFEDNFDSNCADAQCYGSGCTSSYPTTWDQWYCEDSQPVTRDSVSHHGGEITSTGRGGSGKSLKMWRYDSTYGNYTGALLKYISGSYSSMYFRYYMKFPTAFTFTGDSGFKLWRLNTSGGSGEIYLNIVGCSGSCYTNGTMSITDYGSMGWTVVLDNTALRAVWDGNWHCMQWFINTANGNIILWVDGVEAYNRASGVFSATGTFSLLQHFGIGNSNDDHIWVGQSSWQAAEFDDLIMATTKAETDPDSSSSVGNISNITIGPGVSFR